MFLPPTVVDRTDKGASGDIATMAADATVDTTAERSESGRELEWFRAGNSFQHNKSPTVRCTRKGPSVNSRRPGPPTGQEQKQGMGRARHSPKNRL